MPHSNEELFQYLLDGIGFAGDNALDVLLLQGYAYLLAHLFVEYFPVGGFSSNTIGGGVVVEVYLAREEVVDEFRHHHPIREVSVDVLLVLGEGDGVHSLIDLLQFFSAQRHHCYIYITSQFEKVIMVAERHRVLGT